MKKSHKVFITIGSIVLALALVLTVLNLIPPKKNVESNPFLVGEGKLPMIAAHRGGGANNPENTMLAFREAVYGYDVDILESDLYMTRDGHLVYNHDAYIDETCNVNGDILLEEVRELCKDESRRHYIKDMTLEELQRYNFGYYFEDKNGERIYQHVENVAEAGLQIATVDALFEEFYKDYPELLFILEIKDSGERGVEACRILSQALEKYSAYVSRVVVGTFHNEIEVELRNNYPHLLRGAPTGSAAKFILTQYFGVNLLDNGSDFACLQIPMAYDVGFELSLTAKTLVRRAHRRNIAVQYWTINDAEDMRTLIEMGVDCIMTDDPALLAEVLKEYQ